MADSQYLLDSNICIYLLGDTSPTLTGRVADQPVDSLFISSITLAEIAVGYGESVFDAPNLNAMLAAIPVQDFDDKAARIFGTLPFRRSRMDRLIAAHALALGFILVTNNEADFADVPGLKIENWTR
ncbi:MAG TPA: type II toxin-antitoxin system VapC family toxin [Sphingobium sp.]